MKNGCITQINGTKCWYKDDLLHREDGPALEMADGCRAWYQDDKKHRIKGPAYTEPNGFKSWWRYNQRHRLNAPAIIYINLPPKYFHFGYEILHI